ncbi:MAG: helix-turn-helix domain-containing protein [Pseudomonadota bacterium]|jgi:cytoskeleton protein RodZ|nr:helix-turn-helix domain-containing protein [Pseudomonadota bacterium]
MAEAPGGEPRREGGSGIGARLRAARERSGMSLAQAAHRLHVSADVLEALEDEQFERLGAPIYVKSYLGRYAELLGESAQALQAELAGAAMAAPDLTRIPRAAPASGRASALLAAAGIGVAVVLAAGLSWWGWTHVSRHAVAVVGHSGGAGAPTATAPAAARPRPPATAASSVSAVASVPASAPAAAPAVSSAPTHASEMRISLQFPTASWVSVTDATGRSLFRGLVLPGTLESFAGPGPLHVVLGYADGVALKVNGRSVPLAPYVGRDHAASVAVAADGEISPVPRHASHAGG